MRARDRIYQLLLHVDHDISGHMIGCICGLGSWRLYPALTQLEREALITSDWDLPGSFGVPRRRMYRLKKSADGPLTRE